MQKTYLTQGPADLSKGRVGKLAPLHIAYDPDHAHQRAMAIGPAELDAPSHRAME